MSILISKNAKAFTNGIATVVSTMAIALTTPALAGGIELKTVWDQQVGQWADAKTAPEVRTRCKTSTDGNWPWGGKWKVCKQWLTEARVMEITSNLVVRAPKGLEKADKKKAQQCAGVAAVSAAQLDTSDTNAAQTVAQTTFSRCADSVTLTGPDRFTIAVETRNSWSTWH